MRCRHISPIVERRVILSPVRQIQERKQIKNSKIDDDLIARIVRDCSSDELRNEVKQEVIENIDSKTIANQIKIQVFDQLKPVPKKENTLSIFWKISTWITLVFLIFSYFNSVNPVFDKYEELQEEQNTIDELSSQIEVKDLYLKYFTISNNIFKKENMLLKQKLTDQSILLKQYVAKTIKFEQEILETQAQIEMAKFSAVLVLLKQFKKELHPQLIINLKITRYELSSIYQNYSSTKLDALGNDAYGSIAIILLHKFTTFKNGYNIEILISYLSYYYQLCFNK